MKRFRRAAHHVEAMLFDGTPDCAATLTAAFAGVFRHGEGLEVATGYGRVFIGAGIWIVRDLGTQALRVMDHQDFAAAYQPADGFDVLDLGTALTTGMIAP